MPSPSPSEAGKPEFKNWYRTTRQSCVCSLKVQNGGRRHPASSKDVSGANAALTPARKMEYGITSQWTHPHHSGRRVGAADVATELKSPTLVPSVCPGSETCDPSPSRPPRECAPLRTEGERRAGPGADAERRPQNWGPQSLAQPRERGRTGRPSPNAPPTERKMPEASLPGVLTRPTWPCPRARSP